MSEEWKISLASNLAFFGSVVIAIAAIVIFS